MSERTISADQVAWMLAAIERYASDSATAGQHPRVSRAAEMRKLGLLYEIMDAAALTFQDEAANWEAIWRGEAEKLAPLCANGQGMPKASA